MASQPSPSTIKRLFARSGNRCAFPRCAAPLAVDDTLVGEVCHIKGRNAGSARFDSQQSDVERNDYENLILLCPTHHTVVDDDTEAYTVDRLTKMKAAHEAIATVMPDDQADKVAANHSLVSSIGQASGITANSVTVGTISLPHADQHVEQRRVEAIENVWEMVRTLRREFGPVAFVDSFMLAGEMDEYFRSGRLRQAMAAIEEFRDPQISMKKLVSVDPDKERLFIGQRLWSIVFVLRGLYARTSLLINLSFKEQLYQDWRADKVIEKLLRSLLPSNLVDEIKQRPIGGLNAAIEYLEHLFLREAGMQR